MSHIGTRPPSGVKESCIAFTEPLEAAVVAVAQIAEFDDAEAHLLAFHVAAGLHVAGRGWSDAGPRQRGIARLLAATVAARSATKTIVIAARMAQPWRESPTMRPKVMHSAAEMSRIESISRKFESGVGFSKRMRGVHVEEAAAVGAELLDGDLRGGRADGDHLLARRRCSITGSSCSVLPSPRLRGSYSTVSTICAFA